MGGVERNRTLMQRHFKQKQYTYRCVVWLFKLMHFYYEVWYFRG